MKKNTILDLILFIMKNSKNKIENVNRCRFFPCTKSTCTRIHVEGQQKIGLKCEFNPCIDPDCSLEHAPKQHIHYSISGIDPFSYVIKYENSIPLIMCPDRPCNRFDCKLEHFPGQHIIIGLCNDRPCTNGFCRFLHEPGQKVKHNDTCTCNGSEPCSLKY